MSRAFTEVRRLTKRRGANFSLGFRLLPAAKRRAVYAAYAACRVADDLVDEAAPEASRSEILRSLDAWATEIEDTFQGRPRSPITVALANVLGRFAIPQRAFLDLIDGCRMDVERSRYTTFEELARYCELVAVTISEISLAIFGLVREEGLALGSKLAMALQLTNICRDVREDAARGRIYLPLEELSRYGVSEIALQRGSVSGEDYRALMIFQCDRARSYFRAANPLPECLAADTRPAVRVMGGVYRRVLDRVAARPADGFFRRVELPRWQRLTTVASGLLGRPFVAP